MSDIVLILFASYLFGSPKSADSLIIRLIFFSLSFPLPLNPPPNRLFHFFRRGVFRGFYSFSKKKSNAYVLVYQKKDLILQKSQGVSTLMFFHDSLKYLYVFPYFWDISLQNSKRVPLVFFKKFKNILKKARGVFSGKWTGTLLKFDYHRFRHLRKWSIF